MSTIRVVVEIDGEEYASQSLTDDNLTAKGIAEKYGVNIISTASQIFGKMKNLESTDNNN